MKRAISLLVALVLCVSLCACGGVDERYTALIACLDSHDYEGAVDQVMMLREQAIENGDIVIVEPQEEDRKLVQRYLNVARQLMNYKPYKYFSIWDSETEESFESTEALAFCYKELQSLDGVDQWLNTEYFSFEDTIPTDRNALLDRFTIVENKLLQANSTTVDNMGNENTSEYYEWFYTEDGTLETEYINWEAARNLWNGLYSTSGYYRYTYNEAGVITETKITNLENTSVSAVIVPVYDANGNLISETITDNNGSYVFHHTYDANGNRTQTDYADEWNNYTIFYTYDDQGHLVQTDICRNGSINWNGTEHPYITQCKTTVNTYDGNGNLISAVVTDIENDWTIKSGELIVSERSKKVDTVSYTYDAENRLAQESWQYGNRDYANGDQNAPEYKSRVIDYIYGDYYIFK